MDNGALFRLEKKKKKRETWDRRTHGLATERVGGTGQRFLRCLQKTVMGKCKTGELCDWRECAPQCSSRRSFVLRKWGTVAAIRSGGVELALCSVSDGLSWRALNDRNDDIMWNVSQEREGVSSSWTLRCGSSVQGERQSFTVSAKRSKLSNR